MLYIPCKVECDRCKRVDSGEVAQHLSTGILSSLNVAQAQSLLVFKTATSTGQWCIDAVGKTFCSKECLTKATEEFEAGLATNKPEEKSNG